ncbi:hypothetical protein [Commensalibacter intestini]|uniref:hypothetical protein n=1 Tax=Commensalibacter intestini TaxID=479936 RepID=UPI0002DA864A|nr:hypothetical protein [Commensalibacter intestini]
MKKTLLTLTIFLLPLTAQAKDTQKYMPPELVDQAVTLFAPDYCPPNSQGGRVRGIVKSIAECYQQVPIENPIMDVCLMVDGYTMSIVNTERKDSRAHGESRPYKEIPFLERDAFTERFVKITSTSPRYEHVGNLYIYFDKATNLFVEQIAKECQNPKYSAKP